MEPVTHLLTSLALSRAGLKGGRGPSTSLRAARSTLLRAPSKSRGVSLSNGGGRLATAILVIAGLAPDLDFLSRAAGPLAYFRLHRAATHSLLGAAALAILVAALFWWLGRRGMEREWLRVRYGPAVALAAVAIAAHLLLDLGTSYGVCLLWPFSGRFYAWNLWAEVDPWILVVLVAGIFLPALLGLVASEIGARSTRRASRGAWAALALLAFYGAGRGALHARARALLASRLYHEETPLAVGAFPSPAAPFAWRGVVETADTIESFELSLLPGTHGGGFEPDRSQTHFKPPRSPALERARATPLVQQWLRAARFPLATVEQTEDGYRVEFRDLRYPAGLERFFMPVAVIRLDSQLGVASEGLIFGSGVSPGG